MSLTTNADPPVRPPPEGPGEAQNRVLDYGSRSALASDRKQADRGRPGLARLIQGSPYQGYTYAYPHKTSYRPLPEPIDLDRMWAGEDRDALFLYLHVPFCEMRCGFCNLFTQARPKNDLPARYLAALERQARQVRRALGEARFARVAFGGGTPTQLPPALLARLFDLTEAFGGLDQLPVSLETSPETASEERLTLAAGRGIDRVSIGIQSFDPSELKALGRPQSVAVASAALDRIRGAGFDTLNVDLIYGIAGQSTSSWLASVRTALTWHPEELYLYPLYLRPLTGLGKHGPSWDDHRLECYRAARDLLGAEGYEQFSMRFFRRSRSRPATPPYSCQDDGMVGLGCGARSYTRALHYCDEWAVSAGGVKNILGRWVERDGASFSRVWHGYRLDGEEQRRRYLVQSLLNTDGLDLGAYRDRFDSDAWSDFPQLEELLELDLAELSNQNCPNRASHLVLNARGLELSDCVGPWLYSDRVHRRGQEYVVR